MNLIPNEKTIMVYTLSAGFTVEVEIKEDCSDFYICHKDYGDKMYMFGLENKDITSVDDIILSNANEYMELFCDTYVEE